MTSGIRKRRRAFAVAGALIWAGLGAGCAGLPTADWPPARADAPAAATAAPPTAAASQLRFDPWQALRRAAVEPQSLSQPMVMAMAPQPPAPLTFARGSGLPTSLAAPFMIASASAPRALDPLQRPMPAPPADIARGSDALLEPAVVRRTPRLQCVPYARAISGVEIYGNANTWWRQAEGRFLRNAEPALGAVIAMRGYRNPNRGHVAVVTGIRSEREILVDHANWLNRGEISVRTPMLDVSDAGDWSEVRVWHIPSGRWGARVYSVHGFIHQG